MHEILKFYELIAPSDRVHNALDQWSWINVRNECIECW